MVLKRQMLNFTDTLYNSYKSFSNEKGGRGPTNPSQVGLGVKVGTITQNFTKGDFEQQQAELSTVLLTEIHSLLLVD